MKPDRGVAALLCACGLTAVMGAAFYQARQNEAGFSAINAIFIRVVLNAILIVPFLWQERGVPALGAWRTHSHLWCWGVFGALTVGTFYWSVLLIGAGMAGMLNTASGVFTAALAPWIVRQSFSRSHVLYAMACFIGVVILAKSVSAFFTSDWGFVLAGFSGLFSAIAYMMVARGGQRDAPEKVLFYWTVVNVVAATAGVLIFSGPWPELPSTWFLLVLAGLCAAGAQYLTTFAYQRVKASRLACLGFLAPALSFVIDVLFFGLPFRWGGLYGLTLILLFGLVFPLYRKKD